MGGVTTEGKASEQARGLPVHRLVGQAVGVLLCSRGIQPYVTRPVTGAASADASVASGFMSRVLDLPAARHLLDDELEVHARPRWRPGPAPAAARRPAMQAPVLGDVVRGDARCAAAALRQHLARRRVAHHRAVARRAPGCRGRRRRPRRRTPRRTGHRARSPTGPLEPGVRRADQDAAAVPRSVRPCPGARRRTSAWLGDGQLHGGSPRSGRWCSLAAPTPPLLLADLVVQLDRSAGRSAASGARDGLALLGHRVIAVSSS